MLALWDYAKREQIVSSDEEWCERIGFSRPNLYNVRTGHQSFTVQHIHRAAILTGANANWILGLEESMFRTSAVVPAIVLLRRAVTAIENEMNKIA